MLVGIRPGDDAYNSHTGLTFHPQDESGGGNISFYEVNATTDQLEFDLATYVGRFSNPTLILNSVFGPTDFTLYDRDGPTQVIDEQSGYDSDVWIVDLSGTSGNLRLTDFDTNAGVTGTQAGWYAYVTVAPLQ